MVKKLALKVALGNHRKRRSQSVQAIFSLTVANLGSIGSTRVQTS